MSLCCNEPLSPPWQAVTGETPITSITLNNVTITASGNTTYDVLTEDVNVVCVDTTIYSGQQVVLLAGLTGVETIYEMYFDNPINEITFLLTWSSVSSEYYSEVNFETDSGTPSVSLCENCCGTLSGNTFIIDNSISNPLCGTSPIGSYITLSNSNLFTNLTLNLGPNDPEAPAIGVSLFICSLSPSALITTSANTLSTVCVQICTTGDTGSTVVSVNPPHPTWSSQDGGDVVQLNMVLLGGNGLNG